MTFAAQVNKPELKEGARGEAVRELQRLLYKNGAYALNCNFGLESAFVDGIFGSDTTNAVKAFQYQVFLTEDGIVGDNTWRTLYKNGPVDMPVLKIGSKGKLVAQVQERLKISQDYQGVIDGEFGLSTQAAVKALQKRAGLLVDGIIGDITWLEVSKFAENYNC